MSDRRSFAPQLWLLSMNLIWGVSYSAVKYALDRGLQPFALMTARFWLACLFLMPLVAMRQRPGENLHLPSEHVLPFLVQ